MYFIVTVQSAIEWIFSLKQTDEMNPEGTSRVSRLIQRLRSTNLATPALHPLTKNTHIPKISMRTSGAKGAPCQTKGQVTAQ